MAVIVKSFGPSGLAYQESFWDEEYGTALVRAHKEHRRGDREVWISLVTGGENTLLLHLKKQEDDPGESCYEAA